MGSRTLSLFCVSLALALLLPVSTPTRGQDSSADAAGDPDRDENLHHGEVVERCAACHTDETFAGIEIAEGCSACHEGEQGGELRGPLKQAFRSEQEALDETYGMQLALYYQGSRLGADPGPMVRIPSGKFIMGSDDRFSDEGPQHVADLDDYLIDKYEVTNLQYQRFIDDTGRRAPRHFFGRGHPPGKADHPVTFVSWFDARDYCRWAGKRLPTEQEWEKAGRGEDGRVFPWGNQYQLHKANTPVRWGQIGTEGDTTPVGAFADGASPYGLYDMSGNVWEWTASWYLPHPGNQSESENFGKIYRVLKGGSWWDCSFYKCGISAPLYNRSFFNPRVQNATFGFRCARDGDGGGI